MRLGSIRERILSLNWQVNEYKLPLFHLFTWAELALTHRLDFRVHAWFRNLFLLPLVLLLWRTYFADEVDRARRMLLFLPIVFLVFSLSFAQMEAWPTAGMMYQPFLCFALASSYFLSIAGTSVHRRRTAFVAAALFALLACYSCPTSIVLLPLGLVVLLHRKWFAACGVWLALFVAGLFPYLYLYYPLHYPAPARPWLAPPYFLAFAGSAIPNTAPPDSPVVCFYAIPFDAVICLVLLDAVRTHYHRGNLTAVLFTLVVLGSGAFAALGRNWGPLATSTTSRYKLFSNLLLVFCYGYAADRIRRSA